MSENPSESPAGREPRIQVLELVFRRAIPVGIEPQQGDLLRSRRRQRLLDEPFDEVDAT